jgi:tetratricopeptide (TPR) repeat protein
VVADRAAYLDPQCLQVNTMTALVRYAGQDYARTIDRCQYVLELDEAYAPARRLMGAAQLLAGQGDQALETFRVGLSLHPHDPVLLGWAIHAHARLGSRADALALHNQLDALATTQYVPSLARAIADIGLGRLDEACAAIDAAYDERDPLLSTIATDARFTPLHSDDRYKELLARLGLPRPSPVA